jgi:hypothetical protein
MLLLLHKENIKRPSTRVQLVVQQLCIVFGVLNMQAAGKRYYKPQA